MNRAEPMGEVRERLGAIRERMRELADGLRRPGQPAPMLPKPTAAAPPPRPWQDREPGED